MAMFYHLKKNNGVKLVRKNNVAKGILLLMQIIKNSYSCFFTPGNLKGVLIKFPE